MANTEFEVSENVFCLAFAAWLSDKSMGLVVSGVGLSSVLY